MKWEADILHPKHLHFIIEGFNSRNMIDNQPVTGYYVYVYENGQNLYDYLQDTLEQAKGFALRKFNVPLDAWKQINE